MQTTAASGSGFNLSSNPETPSDAYDAVVDSHTEAANSRGTIPSLYPSPNSCDVAPSPPVDANTGTFSSSGDRETSVYPYTNFETIPILPHGTPRDEELLTSGMHPARPEFAYAPPITICSFSPEPSERAYPIESDSKSPAQENFSEDANRPKEKKENAADTALLQKLAADHLAITGLRSLAQEQGKKLRRLYRKFHEEASTVLEGHRDAGSDSGVGSSLSEQMNAISKLLSSIEDARRVFHESQERLSTKEWALGGRERRIYAQFAGRKVASTSGDEPSEDSSGSPSVSPPRLSDEDTYASASLKWSDASLQAGIPESGVWEVGIESGTKDDLEEVIVPAYVYEYGDPIALARHLPNPEPIDELIDPKYTIEDTDTERLSALIRHHAGRTPPPSPGWTGRTRVTKVPNPEDLGHLGSQFASEPIPPSTNTSNPARQIGVVSNASPMSDYIVPRVSKWLAFGVPWTSFTPGRRHRPYRLPDGVSPWQVMAINHYGATALGEPISGQLGLAKSHADRHISATRKSLLQNWFWDPKARSDLSSSSRIGVGRAEKQIRTTQSGASSHPSSARSTLAAVTMPNLGGSMSSTVLLENAKNTTGIMDYRSRFTSAAHTAQSDYAVFQRPYRGREPT